MNPHAPQDRPPVTIRDALPADGGMVERALGQAVEIPAAGSEHPSDRMWVACEMEDSTVCAGTVGLRMTGAHAGEIHHLWVRPERRGLGVGVVLMEACLGYCRDHGVLKTLLEVEEGQTEAIRLFQKVGFLLARSRKVSSGQRLEFYMDLYRDD